MSIADIDAFINHIEDRTTRLWNKLAIHKTLTASEEQRLMRWYYQVLPGLNHFYERAIRRKEIENVH